MGRRYAGLLAILAAAGVLAGCTSVPPGVDGNLTNNWPAMPVAKVSVPVGGACYESLSSGVSVGDDSTVPCTASHVTETVYVGTFSGADADRSAPPAKGSQALATTFGECRKNATAYLGDDFAMGNLDLDVVLPSAPAWNGGARWYRCDIVHYASLMSSTTEGDTGSVKDGLTGARPLAITCLLVTDDGKNNVTEERPVTCDQPHNGELAGLFTAPDLPWPTDDKARSDLGQKGCEGVVAKFLGLSGGHVTNSVLGWGWDQFAQADWELGNRTIRCTVMAFKGDSVNGARYSGSVKGTGNKTPPKA